MFFEADNFIKARIEFKKALNEKVYDPVLKKNKEYEVDILWHLGIISYETEDKKRVINDLHNVLGKINDSHYYYANTHLNLGHFYLIINRYEKARQHYNKVLQAPSTADEEMKMAKECLAKIPLDG